MNAMTGFKIDRSVPIPTEAGRVGSPRKYPFADMAVGDSIFIPSKRAGVSARSSAFSWGRSNNCTFASRSEGNGMRIWRTT